MRRSASQFPRKPAAFIVFLALLFLAPLPLGSNRALPLAVLEVGLFAVSAWTLLAWYRQRQPLPSGLSPYLLLGAVWLGYHLIHLVPLPASVVQALNPASRAAYSLAGNGAPGSYSLSVDRYETLGAAIQSAAFLAAFVMAFIWCASVRRMVSLMRMLVAIGLAEVIFGLSAELMANGHYALADRVPDYLALEGTYVNPNHLAGLLELSIGACLGLALSESGRSDPGRFQPFRSRAFLWSALGILGIGLVLTASRGGVAAIVLSGLLVGLPSLLRAGIVKRFAAPKWLLVIALAFVVLVGGFSGVIQKLGAKSVDGDRLAFWEATLELSQAYPAFGSGPGTYFLAMRTFKPASLGEVILDHAHNDYLELLAEYGAVGAAVLGVLLVLIVRAMFLVTACGGGEGTTARYIGLNIALASLSIHGLVDFNLQIPANGLWFCVIAGVVASQAARCRAPRGLPGAAK